MTPTPTGWRYSPPAIRTKITRASVRIFGCIHLGDGTCQGLFNRWLAAIYMQAGFAAMVFSAKARKSDSDTYPGRPSILLSDSQILPDASENLRNHFSMECPA